MAVAAALFAQSAAGQSFLRSSGLSPDPERYTERAFEQPEKLPTRFTGGQPTSTSFRIRNVEGSVRNYDWTVDQHRGDGSGRRVLRRGRTTLRPGDTALVKAPIRPVCATYRRPAAGSTWNSTWFLFGSCGSWYFSSSMRRMTPARSPT